METGDLVFGWTGLLIKTIKKVAHTRLPSVAFRSWSWFLSVSLQVTWVINLAVGCHYFLPGLQLPPQPSRGLLPILLLGEQRRNGCEQFAQDCCYPTASRLRFEPRPFCAWVQHANHSATEPPNKTIRLPYSVSWPIHSGVWRCRAYICVAHGELTGGTANWKWFIVGLIIHHSTPSWRYEGQVKMPDKWAERKVKNKTTQGIMRSD